MLKNDANGIAQIGNERKRMPGSTASGVRIGKTFFTKKLIGGRPIQRAERLILANEDAFFFQRRLQVIQPAGDVFSRMGASLA